MLSQQEGNYLVGGERERERAAFDCRRKVDFFRINKLLRAQREEREERRFTSEALASVKSTIVRVGD